MENMHNAGVAKKGKLVSLCNLVPRWYSTILAPLILCIQQKYTSSMCVTVRVKRVGLLKAEKLID